MTGIDVVKQKISSVLAYRYKPLTKREQWGEISFDDCAPAYDRVFSSLEKICLYLDKLPSEVLKVLFEKVQKVEILLMEIDNFTIEGNGNNERRENLANQITSISSEIETNSNAWISLLELEKPHSPIKKLAHWMNEYKEVVLLIFSVLIIWSHFATKNDLQNNVDRLTCLLNAHVVSLSTQNEMDRLSLELDKKDRQLERWIKQNAFPDEIDKLKKHKERVEVKIREIERQKDKISKDIDLLSGRTTWSDCPI